jgi:hypothetical protein
MKEMMMRIAMTVLLLAALAGCEDGKQPANVKKIEVTGTSPYLERLRGLDDQSRNLALRRSVIDSGQRCKRVENSAEIGSYKTMVMWTVRCEGERDWAVFIAPSGDVQVRDCKDLEQLDLPKCRLPSAPAKPGAG